MLGIGLHPWQAAAQCTAEGLTTGEARQELAALLSEREGLSDAEFEAKLLPFAQRVPCVPAAILPLAEAQLAQGKRKTAMVSLTSLTAITTTTPQLTAARALLTRLRRQSPVVVTLPEWVPETTRVLVRGAGEGAPQPATWVADGPRRWRGWFDPGEYTLACEGPLLLTTPSPAALRVAPATEASVVVTPTPLFLPVDHSALDEPLQTEVQAAEAAASAGKWARAAQALESVVSGGAFPRVSGGAYPRLSGGAFPRLRFNLAVARARAGDALGARVALTGLAGLPPWAEPFAEAQRRVLDAQLVRVSLHAPGVALRVDGRAVMAHPMQPSGQPAVLVLGTPQVSPQPLAAGGVLWLAPAAAHRLTPVAPVAHRMLLEGAGRSREVERPGSLTVELAAGETYRLVIEKAALAVAEDGGRSWLGPGLLLGGGLAVGATSLFGFFLPAQRLFDEANCDGDGRCADLGKAERAQDRADIATVGTVVSGGLLLGAAAWALYNLVQGDTPPPQDAHAPPRLSIAF